MDISCVLKIGGSLLELPELPARLRAYLADFSRPHPVALCGGGAVVEAIRRWDRSHDLGEETSHWIALRALSVTAALGERLLEGFEHTSTPSLFADVWKRQRVPLYDAETFVREIDEGSPSPLPRRWRVTSDSLAARMATTFGAPELVLFKSCGVADGTTTAEAARLGHVDPHFPIAAEGVPRIISVNLRASPPEEALLVPPDAGDV